MAAADRRCPSPLPDQRVYDTADALLPATRDHAEQIAHAIAASSGIEVVVYTQRADASPVDRVDPRQRRGTARCLAGVRRAAGRLVMLVELEPDGTPRPGRHGPRSGLEAIIDAGGAGRDRGRGREWVASDSVDTAVIVGLAEILRESLAGDARPAVPTDPGRAGRRAARPVRRSPTRSTGQAVYDFAGVFDAATIAEAEATIDAIEAADRRRGRGLQPGRSTTA